jgi:PPOX class probable F420-dependent enzyme
MASEILPDPGSEFGQRVRTRLRDERVIWCTTVGADGTAQPNPVWFLWTDPASVLIYNLPTAKRLAHIASRPRVTLNLDGNGQGGDIVVLTGRAQLAPQTPAPHENPEYLAKYHEPMAQVSGSPEAFSASYSVAIAVQVDRVRGH